MRLMADKTGERFLTILEQDGDNILVQFISANGELQGRPFRDSLRSFEMVGWQPRRTSTAIGLQRFKQGYLEDAHVSFALHQLYPLGRKVQLPSGEVATIASYANTHTDGYYMYIRCQGKTTLERKRMSPQWQLLPDDTLLALPYFPAPKTAEELANIDEFDQWAGGF